MLTTYLAALTRALTEEMERDPSVILMGEDIGPYGGAFKVTDGLWERFGDDRVIDTPIAEAGIIGAAVGAALGGMRPVVEMQFMDFISSGWTQLVQVAAKRYFLHGEAVPLVVRGPGGGGVHSGPYHSQCWESFLAHVPGLKVVVPSTVRDALGLLKSAIRDPDPVVLVEHKKLYRSLKEELPDGEILEPLGQAAVRRPGRDATLLTWGAMVQVGLEAAEQLSEGGAGDLEVIDLRTIVPLDRDAVLRSVQRTSKALILHEDTRTGGFGAELAAILAEEAFDFLDGPVVRVTTPDTPIPYARYQELALIPSVDRVVDAARRLLLY